MHLCRASLLHLSINSAASVLVVIVLSFSSQRRFAAEAARHRAGCPILSVGASDLTHPPSAGVAGPKKITEEEERATINLPFLFSCTTSSFSYLLEVPEALLLTILHDIQTDTDVFCLLSASTPTPKNKAAYLATLLLVRLRTSTPHRHTLEN